MSQLLDLYQSSTARNVVEARTIPQEAVDFFDRQNLYSDGFKTNEVAGGPGDFSQLALMYYNTELKNIVIPQSFIPQAGIPLNRYNPSQPFYNPGTPQT